MVVRYFLTTEFSYSSLNEQKINIFKQFKNFFVKIVKKSVLRMQRTSTKALL